MEIRLHRLLGPALNVPPASSGSQAGAAAALAVEHGPDPAGGRSPRVLMVVESCGGGVSLHVFDLVEGLLDRGWNVHLIYSPRRADRSFLQRLQATRHLKYAGCPMHRAVHPSDLTALRFVCRYIRDYGPFDIIHGHSSKGGALARLAAIGTAARVVYTPHAFVTMDPRLPWRERMLYRAAEWMLSRLTDRIIAVSPAERRHGVAMGLGPSRVIVIPIGIKPAAPPTRGAVRRELGLAEDELVIGFVGRLVDQKAPDVLVRAFAATARAVTGCRLVVVGSGPLEGLLHDLADRLGFGDRILWLGERDGASLMSAFDIFALPSRYEGMPRAALEALAAGLPVLATASAGVEILVRHGHNGLIVPPDRPDLFAAALADLIADPDRRARLGRASLERATQFTVERMVDRTIAEYRRTPIGTIAQGVLVQRKWDKRYRSLS